ncbi:hypothetical protein DFR49_0744 [Hephaestia caeni]|uniref:Uncharacterized protein n=1 Tax=Hephaestia caeni TaxID=645617 RepID=A0A397PKK8_9SPHN|nr:hypothetical protein [Hephaestia caeni]RIA46211.1 hypothetical protein DFR49_0744 [Hephaestia caeni]
MFDPASRFTQALSPDGLTSLAAALSALLGAIDDCKRTRADIERDPAVLLLARHLGHLAIENRPQQADLRRNCIEAAAAVARTPLLLMLAERGVAYDAEAKAAFHSEGRKAMKRLAAALGLVRTEHEVRSCLGGIAVSGEILLHANEIYVQLTIGCTRPGHEVMFRRVDGRRDYAGGQNHWASLTELLDPDHFAERIRRELGLTAQPTASVPLFA